MARNQGSVLEDVASDRDRHPNAVPLPPTPPDHDETTLVCRAAHARRIPKREDLIRFERRARKRTTSFVLIERNRSAPGVHIKWILFYYSIDGSRRDDRSKRGCRFLFLGVYLSSWEYF